MDTRVGNKRKRSSAAGRKASKRMMAKSDPDGSDLGVNMDDIIDVDTVEGSGDSEELEGGDIEVQELEDIDVEQDHRS